MQKMYPPSIADCLASTALLGWTIPTQLANGTDIAETVVGEFGTGSAGMPLSAIHYIPNAAMALSGTLGVTFTVAKRTAGGAAVTLGTFTTVSTAMVAWTPAVFTLSAGAFVGAGDVVTIKSTHLSTGTATPPGELCIFTSAT